jgi:hypothetical protein
VAVKYCICLSVWRQNNETHKHCLFEKEGKRKKEDAKEMEGWTCSKCSAHMGGVVPRNPLYYSFSNKLQNSICSGAQCEMAELPAPHTASSLVLLMFFSYVDITCGRPSAWGSCEASLLDFVVSCKCIVMSKEGVKR